MKLECTNVGLTTSYKIKLFALYIYIYIYIRVRSDAILCSFLIIKPHIVLHDALQFTTTRGSSMQLLYFASSFVWFEYSHTI